MEKLADHFKLHVVKIADDDSPDWWIYATTWMLVTRNKEILASSEFVTLPKSLAPATRISRSGPMITRVCIRS